MVVLAGSPAPGSDRPAAISTRGGGAAANVAAHLARLGTTVELAGCVGDDPPAAGLRAELAAAGVRLRLRTVPGMPTATIVSLVETDGQRSFLADRGANLALAPGDVPPPRADGHLYVSGYTLLDPRPRTAGLQALRDAVAAGCTVSIDPASTGPLAARYRVVAVKLGPDGALWASGDVLLHRPALQTTVVDTTGAGDAFAAGLLSVWLREPEGDPAAALDAGQALAAAVVRQPGAR